MDIYIIVAVVIIIFSALYLYLFPKKITVENHQIVKHGSVRYLRAQINGEWKYLRWSSFASEEALLNPKHYTDFHSASDISGWYTEHLKTLQKMQKACEPLDENNMEVLFAVNPEIDNK